VLSLLLLLLLLLLLISSAASYSRARSWCDVRSCTTAPTLLPGLRVAWLLLIDQ
jgi:hypothetical protein